MSQAPASIVAYRQISTPKYKKDYAGKLVRVSKMPASKSYSFEERGYVDVPEKLIPDGAVLALHRRDTNGADSEGKTIAHLCCHWDCPVCAHTHERFINESEIASGNITFVEPDPDHVAAGMHDTLYLACPYSHPDARVRQDRWLAVSKAAAWLMTHGTGQGPLPVVFSPISMGHPISVTGKLEGSYDLWQNTCLRLLSASDILIILTLDGYLESLGCKAEFDFATAEGIPTYTMTPTADGYTFAAAPEISFEV